MNTEYPALGIDDLRLQGKRIAGSILGVSADGACIQDGARTSLRESFVRGHDLVARYEQQLSDPVRSTIYWRAERPSTGMPAVAAVSLVVSIETDSLATHPTIVVSSELTVSGIHLVSLASSEATAPQSLSTLTASSGPVEFDQAQLIVWRMAETGGAETRAAETGLSYVEMAHPSDFRTLQVQEIAAGRYRVQWELFGQFLEKGVIRRARMQGLWISRAGDIDQAMACYSTFTASEIPLSA